MHGASAATRRFLPPRDRWRTLGFGAAIVAGCCALIALVFLGETRLAIALSVGFPIIALATLNIRLALAAMVVYLILLGDLRRLLIPIVGWSGLDPLLLLGSGLAILVCAFAVASRKIQLDTPLAKAIAALMVIMALQVFNPKQGGLMVGIGGLMLIMIPLFWFWIGRTYGTETFMNTVIFRIVVPLSIPAALFGIYQAFYGYLPYQLMWYDIAGYSALGSRSNPAPVSFFTSGTEFGIFLSIATVGLWSLVLCRKHRPLILVMLLLFLAVFLTGSRGPVAKSLLACAVLWAMLGRNVPTWIFRGLLALLIAGAGMYWSLGKVSTLESSPVQGKIDRQVQGLMNPADSEKSSVGLHLMMWMKGYGYVLKNPVGLGLGATTQAAGKFGGKAYSTETDLGNMFVSTGIFGGVLYHVIVFLIILSAVRYWRRTRSPLAMTFIGILVVTALGWLRGGGYAVDPLVWICIGALDRLQNQNPPGETDA
jgi:hypothetical protein